MKTSYSWLGVERECELELLKWSCWEKDNNPTFWQFDVRQSDKATIRQSTSIWMGRKDAPLRSLFCDSGVGAGAYLPTLRCPTNTTLFPRQDIIMCFAAGFCPRHCLRYYLQEQKRWKHIGIYLLQPDHRILDLARLHDYQEAVCAERKLCTKKKLTKLHRFQNLGFSWLSYPNWLVKRRNGGQA